MTTDHRVFVLGGQAVEGGIVAPWLQDGVRANGEAARELERFLDAMSARGYELITIHYNSSLALPLAVFRFDDATVYTLSDT